MGCHLYIQRIDNDEEVKIPFFLSVPQVESYKVMTKRELEALMLVNKMLNEGAINQANEVIGYIKRGCPDNEFSFDSAAGAAISYGWLDPDPDTWGKLGNWGFRDKLNELGMEQACIKMLEWEITRIKEFMWTEERIAEILNIFKEGEHYGYTI